MNDPTPIFGSQQDKPQPQPEPESVDWRTVAPRWVLLCTIFALSALAGALITALNTEKSEREQRIEDALQDTPSRYQARLTERVAILETQTQRLHDAVSELTLQIRTQGTATNELTVQLKVLTAELKHQRR